MGSLKYLLQGRPLKHPLHPLLVHLPIGLWMLAVLFDVVSVADVTWAPHAAFWCVLLGVIAAATAAIPGIIDWVEIRNDHPVQNIALIHMGLNFAATALFAISLGIRWGGWEQPTTPVIAIILGVVAYGMVLVSGYLGGVMIYDYGVGVGRHRHPGDLPQETWYQPRAGTTEEEEPGALEAAGDFIRVLPFDQLAEGDTFRADINGYTVCIVKSDGQVFAVQEFCTHRYGPLSEGCIRDGRIICPWHASAFDVRSGEVADGPAKVGLMTFPVEVRANYIAVKVPAQPAPGERAAESAWGLRGRPNPPEEQRERDVTRRGGARDASQQHDQR